MEDNVDDDAVDDVICEQVNPLFTDCNISSCCKSCCREEYVHESDHSMFSIQIVYKLASLECGIWWYACQDIYYDPLPVNDTFLE